MLGTPCHTGRGSSSPSGSWGCITLNCKWIRGSVTADAITLDPLASILYCCSCWLCSTCQLEALLSSGPVVATRVSAGI